MNPYEPPKGDIKPLKRRKRRQDLGEYHEALVIVACVMIYQVVRYGWRWDIGMKGVFGMFALIATFWLVQRWWNRD